MNLKSKPASVSTSSGASPAPWQRACTHHRENQFNLPTNGRVVLMIPREDGDRGLAERPENLPLLCFVDGSHDSEFIRRIFRLLDVHDSSQGSLAETELRDDLIFILAGGNGPQPSLKHVAGAPQGGVTSL